MLLSYKLIIIIIILLYKLLCINTYKIGLFAPLVNGNNGWMNINNNDINGRFAWEMIAAANIGIIEINNSSSILLNNTLSLNIVDTLQTYEFVWDESKELLMNQSNKVDGLISLTSDSINSVTEQRTAGILTDTPLITNELSIISHSFVHFISATVEAEAITLNEILKYFEWNKIGVLISSNYASSELVQILNTKRVEQNLSLPKIYTVFDTSEVSVKNVLNELITSDIRINILATDANTTLSIFKCAKSLNMLNTRKYTWIGTRQWTNILAGWTELRQYSNGVIGTQDGVPYNQSIVSNFQQKWSNTYNNDHNSTFNISMNIYPRAWTGYFAVQSFANALDERNKIIKNCTEHSTLLNNLQTTYSSQSCYNNSIWSSRDLQYCCVYNRAKSTNKIAENVLLNELIRNLTYIKSINRIDIISVYNDNIEIINKYENNQLQTFANNIKWSDGSTTTPVDTPKRVEVTRRSSTVTFQIVVTFAAISIAYAISLLYFNIRYRKNKYIRLSSPNINNLVIFGALLALTFSILFALNKTYVFRDALFNRLCSAQLWLMNLGFTLAFGSLFAKTYRVHHIFNSNMLRVKALHDSFLFSLVGVLVLIDVIFTCLWTSLDPFVATKFLQTEYEDPSNPDILYYEVGRECESNHTQIWLSILLLMRAILLVCGMYLAYQIRNVEMEAMNDSHWISFSIYNTVITSLALIFISFVLNLDSTATTILTCFGVIFVINMILTVLFVPKIRQVFSRRRSTRYGKSMHVSRKNIEVNSPLEFADASGDMLIERIRHLEQENRILNAQVRKLSNSSRNSSQQNTPTHSRSNTNSPNATPSNTNKPRRFTTFSMGTRSNKVHPHHNRYRSSRKIKESLDIPSSSRVNSKINVEPSFAMELPNINDSKVNDDDSNDSNNNDNDGIN